MLYEVITSMIAGAGPRLAYTAAIFVTSVDLPQPPLGLRMTRITSYNVCYTKLLRNIAAVYASRGPAPAIMDFDPQGSAMAWLGRRAPDRPTIHGIAAYKRSMQATRSWQLRVPNETENLIVDSAAGINHDDLRELTRDSSSILVPVLPSMMDTHAASRIIV